MFEFLSRPVPTSVQWIGSFTAILVFVGTILIWCWRRWGADRYATFSKDRTVAQVNKLTNRVFYIIKLRSNTSELIAVATEYVTSYVLSIGLFVIGVVLSGFAEVSKTEAVLADTTPVRQILGFLMMAMGWCVYWINNWILGWRIHAFLDFDERLLKQGIRIRNLLNQAGFNETQVRELFGPNGVFSSAIESAGLDESQKTIFREKIFPPTHDTIAE